MLGLDILDDESLSIHINAEPNDVGSKFIVKEGFNVVKHSHTLAIAPKVYVVLKFFKIISLVKGPYNDMSYVYSIKKFL